MYNPNLKLEWACVQWKDENNFNVVSMGDFVQIKEGDEYEENSFYTVRFGGNKYKARLVCVGIDEFSFWNINLFLIWFNFLTGTKDYCKKCEADCIASINNSLKKNNKEENTRQKSGSTKAALVDNLEKQKNYENDLLKQEVDDYKVKNSKLQNELNQKEKQIEFLQNKSSKNALNGKNIFWRFFLKYIF